MQKELLFDVQFYAFLIGYVKNPISYLFQMNLRMNNVEDKIKQAIDKWNVTGGNIGGGTNVGPSVAAETEE